MKIRIVKKNSIFELFEKAKKTRNQSNTNDKSILSKSISSIDQQSILNRTSRGNSKKKTLTISYDERVSFKSMIFGHDNSEPAEQTKKTESLLTLPPISHRQTRQPNIKQQPTKKKENPKRLRFKLPLTSIA